MTSLDSALAHVDASTFTLQADGTPLPQTSAPGIITALLRLLDVRPGDRVLEIGTGSGYTTAVLASLVGDSGHVTSIDVNPTLTARARALIDAASVVLVSSDGAYGHPPAAPPSTGSSPGPRPRSSRRPGRTRPATAAGSSLQSRSLPWPRPISRSRPAFVTALPRI